MLLLSLMAFDLQGHRGARGLLPENTLVAFERALELGVDTLELDLGLSADGVLVVHHDTHLSPDLARDAEGVWIPEPVALNTLSFAEIRAFDVGRIRPGSAYAGRFGEQRPVDGQRVPALAEVFALSGAVRFNIETKLRADRPEDTASPEAFVEAIRKVVAEADVADRVTVQSFDWRTLELLAGELATACLSEDEGLDEEATRALIASARAIGCGTWSPQHSQLTPARVEHAHSLGLRVVPWTVNEPARGRELISWGVDGLITDYPDRVRGPG
jgi:glycerophosphoryl diester phosphodiesterase